MISDWILGRIQLLFVGASGLFEIAGVLGGLVDLVSPIIVNIFFTELVLMDIWKM